MRYENSHSLQILPSYIFLLIYYGLGNSSQVMWHICRCESAPILFESFLHCFCACYIWPKCVNPPPGPHMEPMLCAVTSANLRGDAGSRIAKISQKVNWTGSCHTLVAGFREFSVQANSCAWLRRESWAGWLAVTPLLLCQSTPIRINCTILIELMNITPNCSRARCWTVSITGSFTASASRRVNLDHRATKVTIVYQGLFCIWEGTCASVPVKSWWQVQCQSSFCCACQLDGKMHGSSVPFFISYIRCDSVEAMREVWSAKSITLHVLLEFCCCKWGFPDGLWQN